MVDWISWQGAGFFTAEDAPLPLADIIDVELPIAGLVLTAVQ